MIRSYRSRRLCRLISSSPFPSLLYYSLLLFFPSSAIPFSVGKFLSQLCTSSETLSSTSSTWGYRQRKATRLDKKEKGKRRVDGSFGNEREVSIVSSWSIAARKEKERRVQREREKGVHDRSFLLPSAEMSPSARPTHLVKSGLWKTERFHKLGRVVVQCRRLWLAVFDAVGPAINQLRSLSLSV